MTQDIPWRKRQEIPDAQIRDAADQYEAARKILASEPPGAGVVLPLINTAAVAIELYLKCLSAELIHTPDKDFPDVSIVTAAPTRWGHQLTTLLEELSDELKQELEAAYRAEFPSDASWTFREVLKVCEGAFAASRYPFEHGADIKKYPLKDLMASSEFLSKFINNLPPKELIQWK